MSDRAEHRRRRGPPYTQPRLMDSWGAEFHGQAETITGDVWWYVDDKGRRRALIPMEPKAHGCRVSRSLLRKP